MVLLYIKELFLHLLILELQIQPDAWQKPQRDITWSFHPQQALGLEVVSRGLLSSHRSVGLELRSFFHCFSPNVLNALRSNVCVGRVRWVIRFGKANLEMEDKCL